MTEKIQGQNLMLFVKQDNGTLKSIAFATNHTLSTSMETIDNSNKDEGVGIWNSYTPGLMNWSVTSENLMSETAPQGHDFNTLFDYYLQRKPVEVAFALRGNEPLANGKVDTEWEVPTGGWTPNTTNQYSGKALITNLEVTATNGQVATYSVTMQGCGTLKKVGDGFVTASLKSNAPIATVETAVKK